MDINYILNDIKIVKRKIDIVETEIHLQIMSTPKMN
jgi:hypothetical protein